MGEKPSAPTLFRLCFKGGFSLDHDGHRCLVCPVQKHTPECFGLQGGGIMSIVKRKLIKFVSSRHFHPPAVTPSSFSFFLVQRVCKP